MAKKLWGGRFGKRINPLVEEFTRSIGYDKRIAEYDLLGSMLHVEILRRAGYLNSGEASKLCKALKKVYASVKNGTFIADEKSEDIHTDIQNKVERIAGETALKLHTARSRNDQVVFATKLYCKKTISNLRNRIAGLISAINRLAAVNKGIVIPGFTHMQHAQPVYLKDYLAAYVKMLERDDEKLKFAYKNINLTMGSGALAGTPIDSSKYNIKTGGLGETFNVSPSANSLDGVSDRDFVIDILSALSVAGMHLSRLAEDLIIWSTKEFDFVEIDESFCTGSSLMPQKKNPDALELIRGYTGRLYGNLVSVLTMMKGLPLSYNRDMQLDKETLFNSIDIVSMELNILAHLVAGIKFNKDKIEEHLEDESLYATDLVYYLVNKKESFKNAHHIVGNLIKYSIDNSVEIKSMTQHELEKFSDKFVRKDILRLFNPLVSVKSKKSIKR